MDEETIRRNLQLVNNNYGNNSLEVNVSLLFNDLIVMKNKNEETAVELLCLKNEIQKLNNIIKSQQISLSQPNVDVGISQKRKKPESPTQMDNDDENLQNASTITATSSNSSPETSNGDSVNQAILNNEFNVVRKKKRIFQTINTNIDVVKMNLKKVNANFSLKQTNVKAPIKITLNSPGEVLNVREALKKADISFHEYKWDEEKAKCFIIKGMVGTKENDLPLIKSELCSAGKLPDDISLEIFKTGLMRANTKKEHNTLIKLVLPPTCDEKILTSIKFIDHVSVKFEAFRAKSIIQCKNCQRFGHSSGGCMHRHRCVKCGEDHLRDACKRTNDKAVKLKCCNCGGEHTANNLSECSYFIRLYANRSKEDKASSQANSSIADHASKFIKPGVSFAAAARNVSAEQINTNSVSTNANFMNFNNELSKKIDGILKLVLKHDQILEKICHDG